MAKDHLDRLKEIAAIPYFSSSDAVALRACVEEIERLRAGTAAKDEQIDRIRTALREAGLEIIDVSSDFGITVNNP